MYSNKENVNILTALLLKFDIHCAVVCPGSRNAPIVHNLTECPQMACFPVTDERSAGFYALGMAQALNAPVVVCVTSGSALLNLAPAVAEAWYQHLPLVVVSADRPQAWIGQIDGQTLPQPGALGCFVQKAVSLPEPCDEEQRWYCNRLVNEALLEVVGDSPGPVHINVPISEPLFAFDTPSLPDERQIVRVVPLADYYSLNHQLVQGLLNARRPMIVFGHVNPQHFSRVGTEYLFSHVIVLHEATATFNHVCHADEVLCDEAFASAYPDFVIYIGDHIVSKRLRHFLRRAKDAQVWRISQTGAVEDTFMNLSCIVVGDPEFVLQSLSEKMEKASVRSSDYRRHWLRGLTAASEHASNYEPPYTQFAAVKCFESALANNYGSLGCPFTVHYANSTAIRLANIYARHHVWCNRGVNGIEGSLSTAAGFSIVVPEDVYCVIGDLSFFYDQNALWNQNLRGNFRILLLNNGRGGIFNMLPGLEQSPARDKFVAAEHHTSAEGICRQNGVVYLSADCADRLAPAIDALINTKSDRPVLLEVFTHPGDDESIYKYYYRSFRI